MTANDREAEDYLGVRLAIYGDTLLVRTLDDNLSICSTYVFERDAGGTNNRGKVTRIFDSRAMAISKDTIVMGSSRDDDHGLDFGPVYIYERDIDSANGWREVKKLISIGSRWPDRFWFFLTISGNALAIGAPRYGSGSVYIFERNWNDIPNSWKQVGYLVHKIMLKMDLAVRRRYFEKGTGLFQPRQ